jgi:hypothetical protein
MLIDDKNVTLRQFIWELTIRKFIRSLAFLSVVFFAALFNAVAAAATIGLSILLLSTPFRYEDTGANIRLLFSPVDTMPEALIVAIAGAALLLFSVLLLSFIGEVEFQAARRLLKQN